MQVHSTFFNLHARSMKNAWNANGNVFEHVLQLEEKEEMSIKDYHSHAFSCMIFEEFTAF